MFVSLKRRSWPPFLSLEYPATDVPVSPCDSRLSLPLRPLVCGRPLPFGAPSSTFGSYDSPFGSVGRSWCEYFFFDTGSSIRTDLTFTGSSPVLKSAALSPPPKLAEGPFPPKRDRPPRAMRRRWFFLVFGFYHRSGASVAVPPRSMVRIRRPLFSLELFLGKMSFLPSLS